MAQETTRKGFDGMLLGFSSGARSLRAKVGEKGGGKHGGGKHGGHKNGGQWEPWEPLPIPDNGGDTEAIN